MASPTAHPLAHDHSQYSPAPSPVTLKPRQNPQKMSITQTFYLAHRARGKLSSEASRQDHNLRLLVGHANLLDALMIHLSEAERDQENWYNNMVRGNEESKETPQAWSTSEPDETEEYGSLATDYDSEEEDSESESGSDTDSVSELDEDDEDGMEIDIEYDLPSKPTTYNHYSTQETIIGVSEVEADYDEEELDQEDDEDEDGMFSLRRTSSHRPPSLCSDVSDEEDDYSNPPSPLQPTLNHPPLSHKEQMQVTATPSYYDTDHGPQSISNGQHESFYEEGFLLPHTSPTMITIF